MEKQNWESNKLSKNEVRKREGKYKEKWRDYKSSMRTEKR
jgi:hypothetical protein